MATTPKARVVGSSENRDGSQSAVPRLPSGFQMHAHTVACAHSCMHTYIYKMKKVLYVLIYFYASVYAHHVCAVPREARRWCWIPLGTRVKRQL